MLFGDWMDRKKLAPVDVVKYVASCGYEISEDMVRRVRKHTRTGASTARMNWTRPRFSPEINRVIVEWSRGRVTWREMFFPEEFKRASGE